MKKNTTKLLILFFTIFILQNNTVHSKIFKFNNLEEARKIYSSNPTKAHDLLDKTIKYYIKKPNKDWPWLGWAYSDKAHFFQMEGNEKAELEYQQKACKIQEQDFKKIKANHKKRNLIQCYYFLSNSLVRNNFLEKSLEISTKAINIFEEFEEFEIDELAGAKEYSHQIVQRARVYSDLFQYKKAINDFEKYLSLVSIKNINELASDNYINALSSLEFIHKKRGDSQKAFKYLKLRYDIIQQYNKNNLKLQSSINREIASHYYDLTQYTQAISYYDKSLQFIVKGLDQNTDYNSKKNFLTDKEIALMGKFNSEQKIKPNRENYKKLYLILLSINEELKLLDKSDSPYTILDTYYTIVTDYKQRKINLDNAKNFIDKQIKEAKDKNDYRLESILSRKRNLMFDQAWNEISLEKFDNALKVANRLKKLETIDQGIREIQKKVDLQNIYGRIYNGLNDNKKAIDYYLFALDILNKSYEKDYKKENTILNNLALAYSDIGEIELANKYIDLATSRNEKIEQNALDLIISYNNKASLTLNEEDYLKNSLKAYEIFNNSDPINKNSINFVNTINILGGYYLRKGHFEKDVTKKKEYYTIAKKYYSEAIGYVEKEVEKNIFPYLEFLYNFSDLIALQDKNYEACIKYASLMSNKLEEINPKDERLIKNYELLYACHYNQDEKNKGFEQLFKAMMVILNKFDQQNFNLKFDANQESISKHKDLTHTFFYEVLKNSHKNTDLLKEYKVNFIDMIFGLQQVVKSNKLTAKLSESIIRQIANNKNISVEMKKYNELLNQKNELTTIDTIDPEKIKKRNKDIIKSNEEIETLQASIIKNYPEVKNNFANQIANGKIIQENIPSDEALIQYSVGNFFTYATIITSENYTVQRINIGKKKLSKIVKNVRKSLELENDNPKKFALTDSQNLYEILLDRMNDLIKDKKKLIIIPDESLYGIPFELLHDKINNKWLIEKHAVSISPSAYSYIALNYDDNLEFSSGNSFLGFGDPVIREQKIAESSNFEDILELEFSKIFTRGGNVNLKYLKMFPELPETAIELEKISKKFDLNSKVYLRDDFNEETINSINFNDYKVVSFASHALVVGEIDGLSEPSIILSLPKKITNINDGLLTASEIIKLNINSDLVILSACNTAASDGNANSEALSGLANSFFYSGAKSLMVTHWSVISNTSVDLMTDTFDFLESSNEDLSIALMKSKIKMLNNPDTSHPIYWAPYTLVGRTKMSIGN